VVNPIGKKQPTIKTGLLKLKTIINDTIPKVISVQIVTGIKFAIPINFCLKQKYIPEVSPILPPINDEGINFEGVKKCPASENKIMQKPVAKEITTNIFKSL
jgi:hypothetical protein